MCIGSPTAPLRFTSYCGLTLTNQTERTDLIDRAEDCRSGDGPGLQHPGLSRGHAYTQTGPPLGAHEEREERQQVRMCRSIAVCLDVVLFCQDTFSRLCGVCCIQSG